MLKQFLRIYAVIVLMSVAGFYTDYATADRSAAERLSDAALERTEHWVVYSGAYRTIEYPNGDVPSYLGVCTDLVIRAYREMGIDLQQRVHEDMLAAFDQYPKLWGLKRPDSNIDHRRVPNLETFFARHGKVLPVTNNPDDYQVGDLVTWRLDNNQPHIGIVVNKRSADGKRPLIVHNIGWGPKLDDMLFDYVINGHYRYLP